MADPSPDIIAGWLVQDSSNSNYQPLRTAIESVLSMKLSEYSPERISEIAEQAITGVISSLEIMIEENHEEGIASSYELSSEGKSSFFKILDTPERILLRSLRRVEPKIFENFCATILHALGCEAWSQGGPNDGCVDFYGFSLQFAKDVVFAPLRSKAMVIGQAKRYAEGNNITLNDVRQFLGGAIQQVNEKRNEQPDKIGLFTPVIFAYWTTSDFHWLAKEYLRKMGMWYLNGIGLAQLAIRVGVNV
jgi:hypothetical protein